MRVENRGRKAWKRKGKGWEYGRRKGEREQEEKGKEKGEEKEGKGVEERVCPEFYLPPTGNPS